MSEKKELKDFLPFYLGQQVIGITSEANVGGSEEAKLDTVGVDCATFTGRLADYYYEQPDYQLQLLLRPLSDMTEEEKKEFIKVCGIEPEDISCVEETDNGITGLMLGTAHLTNVMQWAQGTKYLLSKSFDLFQLIESGLAINKTLNAEKSK